MEVWKAVPQFEGLYEVSNTGKIRSVDHYTYFIRCGQPAKRISKGKELKCPTSKDGYVTVHLCPGNGTRHRTYMHRIVAKAFIPNPENFPVVNHKNEIRDDNRVENLEWCTQEYNLKYGNHIQRVSESLKAYWRNKKQNKDATTQIREDLELWNL